MKTELTSIIKNPVLNRREVSFTIHNTSTPSRIDARRDIAVQMKTNIEQVWIKTLKTKTGTRTTVGLAHVYEDSKKALEVEPKHVIERNKIPEKKEEVEEEDA